MHQLQASYALAASQLYTSCQLHMHQSYKLFIIFLQKRILKNPFLTTILSFMVVSHHDVNINVHCNMIIEIKSRQKNTIFNNFYPFQTFSCPLHQLKFQQQESGEKLGKKLMSVSCYTTEKDQFTMTLTLLFDILHTQVAVFYSVLQFRWLQVLSLSYCINPI